MLLFFNINNKTAQNNMLCAVSHSIIEKRPSISTGTLYR